MNNTRWWKCDFQVATPAWNFRMPQDKAYDVQDSVGRHRFLDDYMSTLKAAGIQVIALADHNTGAWIDDVKKAGARHNIVVFPGCEVTAHTGADGVHLIIIGDLDKTSQDFDRLIYGELGFNGKHPPFHSSGKQPTPGVSSKTVTQLLDDLPDGYLAIAPHAFNDNGIASKDTVEGQMRWRAIHHERLVALDPGDCSSPTGDGFGDKFRRRELHNFPRLSDLAFVSTSDAYDMSGLGKRFTWVRMGEVGIEALRQAFLDHEARILCDWSLKLKNFPQQNPNNVRHAWISQIDLGGALGNSSAPLNLTLHPNLNVIIGGRGSGKSTIVSALRQLYSDTMTLPSRLKEEAENFVETVFHAAELNATHRVQESQIEQSVKWTKDTGSLIVGGNEPIETTFPVTVISQKELFERVAGDKFDPFLSSRSLLSLVDRSINYDSNDATSVDSFGRRMNDARAEWAHAARDLLLMESDLAQLPALRLQVETLQGQVDAFSSPAVKARLERIKRRRNEAEVLAALKAHLIEVIDNTDRLSNTAWPAQIEPITAADPFTKEYEFLVVEIETTVKQLARILKTVSKRASARVEILERQKMLSPWHQEVEAANDDLEKYKAELDTRGLSNEEFTRLESELERMRKQIKALERQESELPIARQHAKTTWKVISDLIEERRSARKNLLNIISSRSGRLRFKLRKLSDSTPWVDALRSIAGLRADAFLDDVPLLAVWLWTNELKDADQRWSMWRQAMLTGNLTAVQQAAQLRSTFAQKLTSLEETVRVRLATLTPDDVVEMEFLKDDGQVDVETDWQSITQGSPGQRTAAMLAFVLHHGREPLVLDQPEDDLDSEWISTLVVDELRKSRWHRQLIVVSHNANIPVLGDAEHVVALENRAGKLRVRASEVTEAEQEAVRVLHAGPVENHYVRNDIQSIMEGGITAFVKREKKYKNETKAHRAAG